MGCCGQKSGQRLQYEVKLNSGEVKTVGSIAEARIAIVTGGGGTYKAVPKTA
jgi:ribosomal protein L2